LKNLKVSIIGSKPNANIPKSDFYYCANSAGSFYKDKITTNEGYKITLVAASEIVKSQRNNKQKEKWLNEKFDHILNSDSDEIILIGNEKFPEAKSKLDNSYKKKISLKSFGDINSLIKNIVGLNFPIITKNHFHPIDFQLFKLIFKYLNEIYLSMYNKSHLCSGLFRPSTGIISLVHAISVHGKNAEYFVCGIGLSQRELYPDGFNNTWTPRKNINTFHVLADKRICEILDNGYNINFDDDSFNFLKNNK
jgi:hypothetical protein